MTREAAKGKAPPNSLSAFGHTLQDATAKAGNGPVQHQDWHDNPSQKTIDIEIRMIKQRNPDSWEDEARAKGLI